MPSETSTPWAVICSVHAQVFLTREEYVRQLKQVSQRWECPKCFRPADWDDDNYESHIMALEENRPDGGDTDG